MQSHVYSTEEEGEQSSKRRKVNPPHEFVKKKDSVASQLVTLCVVCGDIADGCYYNALTCLGCKEFFRRSIVRNAEYHCKYGNNCEIDVYVRRKCQKCQLEKCFDVGMKKENITSEYQSTMSKEKTQKDENKPTSDNASDKGKSEGHPNGGQPKAMTKTQEDVINILIPLQEQYESLSQEDLQKVTAFPLGDSSESRIKRFQHITEITILTVQLIVQFAKMVPGFNTLLEEDQKPLLKACSSEVITLRIARRYDTETDSIMFADNLIYTRENYRSIFRRDSADSIFEFCRNMRALEVDNAEYALLTAIVIFTERPNLLNPKDVKVMQDFYIQILKAYVATYRPPDENYFDQLLLILAELSILGNLYSEIGFTPNQQDRIYLRLLTEPGA